MPNEHEATVTGTPALAPEIMTSEEIELAHGQAEALVRGVRKSTGSRQLAVLDEVTSVGVESQRNAGRQLELVKTRLATFLDAGGASKDITLELVDLRRCARPHQPRAAAAEPVGPHRRDAALHA